MNLDELRSVQSKERRKDSLQHLRDSFYEDVAAYIQDLRATRDRRAERVDSPFSDSEVRRLSDEIETAEEVAEAVYERRVGKVVKLASFSAADMPVDNDGMTNQEQALFEDLVERIKENKGAVLEILAGKRDAPAAANATDSAASAPSEAAPASGSDGDSAPPTPTEGVLADAMGGSSDGDGSPADGEPTPVDPEPAPGGIPPDAPPSDEPVESPAAAEESRPAPPDAPDASSTATAASADASDASAGSSSPTDGEPTSTPSSPSAEATETAEDTERTTVRITQDVGAIFGVDEREYTLRREDVVTLPSANAEPLLQRNAAERLD